VEAPLEEVLMSQVISMSATVQRPLFASLAELRLMERGFRPTWKEPQTEAEIAAEAECDACGTVGLAVVGYRKGEAFAVVQVCPHCVTGKEV
jgi:hypothetical protein